MLVYRIAQEKYALDLSGHGAYLNGGRWNSVGVHALYTSTNRSLAILELLVHVPIDILKFNKYILLTLDIPDRIIDINNLDNSKDENLSSEKIGDNLLVNQRAFAFRVPSVVVVEEHNIIINPHHPIFKDVKINNHRMFQFDSRYL